MLLRAPNLGRDNADRQVSLLAADEPGDAIPDRRRALVGVHEATRSETATWTGECGPATAEPGRRQLPLDGDCPPFGAPSARPFPRRGYGVDLHRLSSLGGAPTCDEASSARKYGPAA